MHMALLQQCKQHKMQQLGVLLDDCCTSGKAVLPTACVWQCLTAQQQRLRNAAAQVLPHTQTAPGLVCTLWSLIS